MSRCHPTLKYVLQDSSEYQVRGEIRDKVHFLLPCGPFIYFATVALRAVVVTMPDFYIFLEQMYVKGIHALR